MEAQDLASYYTVPDTARCLGLPEARVRDWQLKKFIAPALTKGRIQFARVDVVRMFVLDQLQNRDLLNREGYHQFLRYNTGRYHGSFQASYDFALEAVQFAPKGSPLAM